MSRKGSDTRVKIMKATRRMIENGHGNPIRMEDIAQEAGISRQAIYLHFGSRVGLMVSTVQYIDESENFWELTKSVREETDGKTAVMLFIDFWAGYIPKIYGVAKQLIIMKENDDGAAAAWEDRMGSLRNGPCRFLIEHLAKDGILDPKWQIDPAIDFFWAIISIQMWENLVIKRGWSNEQYTNKIKNVINRVLIAGS
jgi:AcrR family transcriptional regulator